MTHQRSDTSDPGCCSDPTGSRRLSSFTSTREAPSDGLNKLDPLIFWEVKINKNEKKTRPQWSSFRSFTDTEYHDIIWIFKVKIDKHGMINACTHCNCYWLSLQYAFSRTSTPPKPEHRLQLPLQFLHCLTLYLAIFHDIQRAGLNFQWYPDALKFPIS